MTKNNDTQQEGHDGSPPQPDREKASDAAPASVPETKADGPSEVFISYSRKDKKQAKRIRNFLSRNHLSVWMDEKIGGGDNWGQRIAEAINTSRVMLLVLSKVACSSEEIPNEVNLARSAGTKIIPIHLEELQHPESISYHLAPLHIVFLYGENKRSALPDLVVEIREYLELPEQPIEPEPERRWVRFGILFALLAAFVGINIGLESKAAWIWGGLGAILVVPLWINLLTGIRTKEMSSDLVLRRFLIGRAWIAALVLSGALTPVVALAGRPDPLVVPPYVLVWVSEWIESQLTPNGHKIGLESVSDRHDMKIGVFSYFFVDKSKVNDQDLTEKQLKKLLKGEIDRIGDELAPTWDDWSKLKRKRFLRAEVLSIESIPNKLKPYIYKQNQAMDQDNRQIEAFPSGKLAATNRP